jgi:hypothetical protein
MHARRKWIAIFEELLTLFICFPSTGSGLIGYYRTIPEPESGFEKKVSNYHGDERTAENGRRRQEPALGNRRVRGAGL